MHSFIKYLIVSITFFSIFSSNLYSTDKDRFCKVASYTFMGLIEEIEDADPKYRLGEIICKAGGGGSVCSSVNNVGKGICYAGDGDGCSLVNNVGKGICKAGDGIACSFVDKLGEGICYAGDGDACSFVDNPGKGICKAGGGAACSFVNKLGEGICKAGGGFMCSSISLEEGICRGAGITCPNASLGEALCKSAGLSNCENITFSQMLGFSVELCGVEIFYNYKKESN